MGYRRGEPKTGYKISDDRKKRIREYLIDLFHAVDKIEKGTQKLFFMDELWMSPT